MYYAWLRPVYFYIFHKAVLVDTHCHLMDSQFKADLASVVERAALGGVLKLMNLGYDVASSAESVRMASNAFREEMTRDFSQRGVLAPVPLFFASQGMHPHEAKHATDSILQHFLYTIRRESSVKMIGETGLDYFYMHSPREAQLSSLRSHMVLARETGLPISIHTRDAQEDMLIVLREFPDVRCIMHCFVQDKEYAREILAMPAGHVLAFGGVVTYPKSVSLRDVVAEVPEDRFVLETDSPYLAPQAHRGQRNEPAYMTETAKVVAEARGVGVEEVMARASLTSERFLGIG